jgi:hypothetical protein
MTAYEAKTMHVEEQLTAELRDELAAIDSATLKQFVVLVQKRGPLDACNSLPKLITSPILSAVLSLELVRRVKEGEL